jgi:sugar phosphate isomerase/epimerase
MIALHTDSLDRYGLNRVFAFAKAAQYDGIEIAVSKRSFDSQNAEYIKALSQEYQIPIVAIDTPADGSDKSVEHVISMAEYLMCPIVVVQAPKLFDFSFTRWLKKNVPILRKKKKIHIALKNTAGKTTLGFLPERALNNLTDLMQFGMVCLDTSATQSKKWDLIKTYEHLKKLIVHVQLSNAKRLKDYTLPMDGNLPIESLLRKLKMNEYKGVISIRVNPAELSAGDDETALKKLREVKTFVEEFFA